MRIGVFSDSYKPYTSGVVTSISTFKEELNKMGHELFIFAPRYPHHHTEEEGVFRFYSVPSPTNHDYTLAIPVLPGMNELIRKLNLDIIHVHTPFIIGRVGLRYARRYNIPLIFTYHTLYDQYVHYVPVAQQLAKDVAIRYSNNFCNHCDHIIVPSTEVKDILNGYQIKTPISVIPTGVPVHKLKDGDKNWLKTRYDIPEKNRVLLFVGRLAKEKNLEFLIQAFSLVKKTVPDTTLVLTAQGPLESELKRLSTSLGLSLERDVIFTGAVPFETLVNIYYSSHLFVFSSMTETQGLVLIEAMATGLPVVAIKAFGVQDMVDNNINGFLTNDNLDEFAQAVTRILNSSDIYERFSQNAIKKAHELSSYNMALKLEAVYKDVASGGSVVGFKSYKNSNYPDMMV
jgi:1,2-diacylglycerol 3-alpha-glucosyltransferase